MPPAAAQPRSLRPGAPGPSRRTGRRGGSCPPRGEDQRARFAVAGELRRLAAADRPGQDPRPPGRCPCRWRNAARPRSVAGLRDRAGVRGGAPRRRAPGLSPGLPSRPPPIRWACFTRVFRAEVAVVSRSPPGRLCRFGDVQIAGDDRARSHGVSAGCRQDERPAPAPARFPVVAQGVLVAPGMTAHRSALQGVRPAGATASAGERAISAAGNSSQVRPSSMRPASCFEHRGNAMPWSSPRCVWSLRREPAAQRYEPHCLNRNGTRAAAHWSRSERNHAGGAGRALGPLSPPAMTQPIGCPSGRPLPVWLPDQ